MNDLSCPNCGAAVPVRMAQVRMTTCESCGTSLFLAGGAAEVAGSAGVLHDVPLLCGIGDRVRVGRDVVTLHGQARFSYGRGFWDEFWGLDDVGAPAWLSVDEGEVVLQRALGRTDWPTIYGALKLGVTLERFGTRYRVTELDSAECTGLRGDFDEALRVGDSYRFVNAENEDGALLSGEIDGEEQAWFEGRWASPWDVTVERAA